MRLKERRDGTSGRQVLVARTTGAERIDHALLRRVSRAGDPVFLPMRYEATARHRRPAIVYDVEGLVSVLGALRRQRPSQVRLKPALASIVRATDVSRDLGIGQWQVLYGVRHTYVDASSQLRFACVPLEGLEYDVRSTPLALLEALSVAASSQTSPAGERELSRRLRKFVEEEGGVFSANDLRRFVADETGAVPLPGTTARDARPQGTVAAYVLRDLATGEEHPLAEGHTLLLGRGADCDVRLCESSKVSRRHAAVRAEGGEVYARDLGSTNGTMVAGRRLEAGRDERVLPGQAITLSDASFCVEARGEEVMR